MRKPNPLEDRARELAIAAGLNPDDRTVKEGSERGQPVWCMFVKDARAEHDAAKQAEVASIIPEQEPRFQNAPLAVFGTHEQSTIDQMRNCMAVGNVLGGVICADGHLGYAQPVGGVVAYEDQISISGVGYDVACGNLAARLDVPFSAVEDKIPLLLNDIWNTISFGVGRHNDERVEHELFDDTAAWKDSGMEDFRNTARKQLGTVGAGNHYVDLMRDENDMIWIGVHFGSRGLGHTTTTRYLKLAGGKDGTHVPPAVVPDNTPLGEAYIAGMKLAGRYAYAGREWVVERVRQMIGGTVMKTIHNHHNYAWKEIHGGKSVWVVRKGATPAFPGQEGFVGGSMGDDAVIIEGVDDPRSAMALYSTIHGAGREFGRQEAKRRFTRPQMDAWLKERGVHLAGGDLDESPMAYRRLPDVLAAQGDTIRVKHRLRPFAVAMAGTGTYDPFKD